MAKLSPIDQYFIDKFREMRKENNLSHTSLAYLLDMSPGYIGDAESGKRGAKYNLKHINKLAEILECSPKDFLPGKPIK
jgi:transcriptional regulator with XRE-family HTH domain